MNEFIRWYIDNALDPNNPCGTFLCWMGIISIIVTLLLLSNLIDLIKSKIKHHKS